MPRPYRIHRAMSLYRIENRALFLYIDSKISGAPLPRMVTHYFTLVALTRELDALLRSSAIVESFTQQKDELIICTDGSPGGDHSRGRSSLHISVNPRLNYLFVENHNSRAKKNSVDLFEEIAGSF